MEYEEICGKYEDFLHILFIYASYFFISSSHFFIFLGLRKI